MCCTQLHDAQTGKVEKQKKSITWLITHPITGFVCTMQLHLVRVQECCLECARKSPEDGKECSSAEQKAVPVKHGEFALLTSFSCFFFFIEFLKLKR